MLSFSPDPWTPGTPEASALAEQASAFKLLVHGWQNLKHNSIWVPLISQTTFSEAAPQSGWWTDDARWEVLLHNWGELATAGQAAGLTQLFIDAEEYCMFCAIPLMPP